MARKDYDGLFLSNGLGDPALLTPTVKHIAAAMAEGRTPIFGICLGHQRLARAAGATTLKMNLATAVIISHAPASYLEDAISLHRTTDTLWIPQVSLRNGKSSSSMPMI